MFLVGNFGELLADYFYKHLPLYLALILLFVVGLGFGAVTTEKLSPLQKEDLINYITNVYSSIIAEEQPILQKVEIFYQSVMDNVIKTTGFIFLLGLTVVGAPLILAIVFVRGFVLGFTVGFLVRETMVKGLVFSSVSILPHNILAVPAIILAAGAALSFSATAFKTLMGVSKDSVYGQFISTTFLSVCSGILLVFSALVETYLTPVLVQLTNVLFG
ncbi:MAG: stage II sporulation protein M [Bacillota bacterium]|nr:stage II sporulation protein M [Bacillota bacterium]